MIVEESIVTAPTKWEKRKLRLMIWIGLAAMIYFLYTLFHGSNRGSGVLYILLMITLLYSCLKVLHEWYHYYAISVPPPAPPLTKTFSVDIFTTFCKGEPYDMLEQTLAAASRIRYPHTTWCCDESDDELVKRLCNKYGAKHITRVDKKDAKAGNINNALKFATGELMVVLDPDHVPAPGFLDKVVPFFQDPAIGFVQVVQAYYNHHQSLVAKGAAQQTYQFYGPMMMSMNTYGTVQAIGANCTFRRAAIDSIGGHASGLAEDMNTAMHLHAKGWKSLYLPAVLTRGLVPATLSAYYKQQLKWSRGTFELLITSFPAFFTKFTWRQKLHYFVLPFHYLCGLIFFINFLIPILSLLSGEIPLSMDISSFFLAAIPLIWMTLLIRHYVQKWVTEERERGFHVVGGLLQIGTWWVHLLGFVYTLLRKKVPYIPTPKNDAEPVPLRLHLPNAAVAVISSMAIAFGLWKGFNPYTPFMAMLAGLNIFFMLFVIRIAGSEPLILSAIKPGRAFKKWLWIGRHWVYAQLRRFAIFFSIGVLAISICLYSYLNDEEAFYQKDAREEAIYLGLESASASSIDKRSSKGIAPAILSFENTFPAIPQTMEMRHVAEKGIVPLLLYHLPGAKSFSDSLMEGKYDAYFRRMAQSLRGMNHPVLLRLGKKTFKETGISKSSWKYIHGIFQEEEAWDVAWVWDAPEPGLIDTLFPGMAYLDWLNIEVPVSTPSNISFEAFYEPYHESWLFTSGLPVMLTRVPENWIASKGFDMGWVFFPEVKAAVMSASAKIEERILTDGASFDFTVFPSATKTINGIPEVPFMLSDTLRGIGYDKGFHWFRNRHRLNSTVLKSDLAEMKRLNINVIMRSMPGVYDQLLLQEISTYGIQLIPQLSMHITPEDLLDDKKMKREKERIVNVLKTLKHEKNIVAWNIGQDMLTTLEGLFHAPELFYYRERYFAWLNELFAALRKTDETRPLGITLKWDEKGKMKLAQLKKAVPQANIFFLFADAEHVVDTSLTIPPGTVWGALPASLLSKVPSGQAIILSAWQDEETKEGLTLDGLLDLDGRKKMNWELVAESWERKMQGLATVPEIKILKPARAVVENHVLTYHALVRDSSNKWAMSNDSVTMAGLTFEWFLIRTDKAGRYLYMKKLGSGSAVSVSIPSAHRQSRLYLRALRNGRVRDVVETLNFPLY